MTDLCQFALSDWCCVRNVALQPHRPEFLFEYTIAQVLRYKPVRFCCGELIAQATNFAVSKNARALSFDLD